MLSEGVFLFFLFLYANRPKHHFQVMVHTLQVMKIFSYFDQIYIRGFVFLVVFQDEYLLDWNNLG